MKERKEERKKGKKNERKKRNINTFPVHLLVLCKIQ